MVWSGPSFEPPERPIDPEDPYADPAALIQHRQHRAREKIVQVEKAKILREKVQACYMKEGVNSMQNCKEVVMDYLESIKGVGLGRMNSGRYDKPPPQAPLE
ncbi:probable NADH dehydrogenase [ubiquinone] 1 beta subcomplex subunit [Coccomyxa sp. Obi]|nr:probable NADH dehydrogenase [ubiquinone] 1 beta subcomplex subunit [Coccomyxa sp. Obi]